MRAMHRCFAIALILGASPAAFAAQGASGTAGEGTAGAGHTGAGGHDPLLTQGAYVARAADCRSCHTAPGGAPFAGGNQLKTPFGAIYGPNITPDADTGIGTWTEADFERALRRGVRKDGKLLYPAMPYIDYTKMSDADLKALWAYMRSVPAVHHVVAPADKTFRFPFNLREGLAAWQALYFKPGPWQSAAAKSYDWNRGSYLVTALGHCGECHSPRNVAMAPEQKYHLTGGQLEGWYAPDISNDPLSMTAKYSVDQVATFLKTGELPGNALAVGPMAEAIHDSLRYLSSSDLHDIALYLKEEPPPDSEHAKPASVTPAELAVGKSLYEDNCAACHQSNGEGTPNQVPALAGNTAVTAAQPNNLVMAMLQGFGPHGTDGAMGSFAKRLTDEQIADIANYVRTAWNNHAEPNAVPWSVGNWRLMADIPARSRQPDLICPLVGADVMRPALREDPALLKRAANDPGALQRVVHDYTAARPKSSAAEVVEALSTAYCRATVSEKTPLAKSAAAIAIFSQDVAVELTRSEPKRGAPASTHTAARSRGR